MRRRAVVFGGESLVWAVVIGGESLVCVASCRCDWWGEPGLGVAVPLGLLGRASFGWRCAVVLSRHVMSCHVMSCHAMSCRVLSCHAV